MQPSKNNAASMVDSLRALEEKSESQLSLLVSIRNDLHIILTIVVIGFVIGLIIIMVSIIRSRDAEYEANKALRALNSLYE